MTRGAVSIKGTREGLTITLGAGPFDEIYAELSDNLKTQGAFFRGGRVALQVGDRAIAEGELTRLNELLSQSEMTLRTVVASHPVARHAVQAHGLRLLEPTPAEPSRVPVTQETGGLSERGRAAEAVDAGNKAPVPRASSTVEGSRGMLIRRLVRSGQVVRHTGHIVVIGDVNVGAEVIAGGDIIVWGRLFGTAHAGAMGDDSAVVCALEFSPLQLRIGNLVSRPAEGARPMRRNPEVATVRDGAIVVQPWDALTQLGV